MLVFEQRGRTLAAAHENPTAAPVEGDADADVRRRLLQKVPECAPFLEFPITAVRLSVPTWRVTDIQRGWLPGKELTA